MRSLNAPGWSSIDARVAAWWGEAGLPVGGARVVVACSGGADSLSLLLCLSHLDLALHAVYVDHGLRAGTDQEAALVRAIAGRLGASAEVVSVRVERRGNLLATARAARYQALERVARGAGTHLVAVGHTASDQAETVALRQLRGDLPLALAGIPSQRLLDGGHTLVRPLLGAGVLRAETRARVLAAGLVPVDDPSNHDARFARVRVRALLGDDGSDQVQALLATGRGAAAARDRSHAQADALGDAFDLDAPSVARAEHGALLVLLHRAGLHRAGAAHVEALAALASSTAGTRRLDLGGGLWAERSYGRLRIIPAIPTAIDEEVAVTGPGSYRLLGKVVELLPVQGGVAPPKGAIAASALPARAVLRNLRAGDRLRTGAGGRKLQDVLVDRKIPRRARSGLVLLAPEGAGDLCWVEGVGASVLARPRAGEAAWTVRIHDAALPPEVPISVS